MKTNKFQEKKWNQKAKKKDKENLQNQKQEDS